MLLFQLLADNPHSKAVQKIVRRSRTSLRLVRARTCGTPLTSLPHATTAHAKQSFAEENEGEEFSSPLRFHIDACRRAASEGAAPPRTSSLWASRPHDPSLSPVLLVDPSTPIVHPTSIPSATTTATLTDGAPIALWPRRAWAR